MLQAERAAPAHRNLRKPTRTSKDPARPKILKKEVIKNSLAVNWLVLQAFTTSAWDLSLVSRQGVPASCASQPPKKKSDLNN